MKKYEPLKGLKTGKGILILVGLLFCTWGSKLGIGLLGQKISRLAAYENCLVNYTSFSITGIALILLELFSRIRFRKEPKSVKLVATLSFGCYLIHCNPVIYHHLLKGAFVFCTAYHPIVMAAVACGGAVVLFLACILVDYLRLLCFQWWKIRERLDALENKLKTVKEENNGNEN